MATTDLEATTAGGFADVLSSVADILLLDTLPFSRVVGVFAKHSAADRTITPERFGEALSAIFTGGTRAILAKATPDELVDEAAILEDLRALAPKLYALFDTNGDGRCDGSELMSGLVALCAGEARDKAVTLFKLFDADASGTITPAEMKTFLTQILKTQRALAPALPEGAEPLPPVEEVADATTKQCFADADVNGDGTLTLQEYLDWYLQPAPDAAPAAEATSAPA